MFRGLRGARRYLLFIQQELGHAVHRRGWNGYLTLSNAAREALRWWTSKAPRLRNGAPIVPETRPLQCSIRSDAATETLGWGGLLTLPSGEVFTTRGHFTEAERDLHINALELLGCFYTIRSLLPQAFSTEQWPQVHMNCQLDNVVAIKYARVAVSRSLQLSRLGAQFTTGPNLHEFSSRFGIWRAYTMLRRTNFLEKNGKKSSGNWILISSSAYNVNGIATSLGIYLQAGKIRSIRSTIAGNTILTRKELTV